MHYQMKVKSIDDISWIIEAAQETMNATEKDFEAIRTKRWYKRLWETVTFSKDNQIKMAKGVSSLSKLQEIMIRLLVVLSQNSTEISNAVKQNSDLINRLAITDALLSRQIDKIKFGGTAQIDFSDLSREKKVLIASLLIMADPSAQRNEYSKQYIGSVLRAANITSFDNTVKIDAVDCLDREEQELLYRMILIDRHLMDIDFDDPCEVIEWISVKPKRKKEIEYSIKDTASAVSPEFFATYYEKTNEILDEVSEEGIWFEVFYDTTEADVVEETAEPVDPIEYEDIILTSILHIPHGEIHTFINKVLHIQTSIDCEGELKFHNCIIHYGEEDRVCEIKVSGNGSILMDRCTIEGHSYSKENIFIRIDSANCTAKFLNCNIFNCSSFLHTKANFLVEKCNIINPGINFFNASDYYNKEYPPTIHSTIFKYVNPPEFIKKSLAERFMEIITANCFIFSECSVTGTLRIRTAEEAAQHDDYSPTFIRSCSFTMDNVQFRGISSAFHGRGRVTNSIFEECNNIFNTFGFYDDLEIEQCKFEKCTNIIPDAYRSSFLHCKFTDCFNGLISSIVGGKTNIEYCEFLNWSAKKEEKSIFTRAFSRAMIELGRGKDKNYGSSSIKSCVFDGMTAHQYYIIIGSVFEKIDGYVAYIDNCTFINCSTGRDDGKVIKDHDRYSGVFKKDITVKTVSIAPNCRGLDQVKKI